MMKQLPAHSHFFTSCTAPWHVREAATSCVYVGACVRLALPHSLLRRSVASARALSAPPPMITACLRVVFSRVLWNAKQGKQHERSIGTTTCHESQPLMRAPKSSVRQPPADPALHNTRTNVHGSHSPPRSSSHRWASRTAPPPAPPPLPVKIFDTSASFSSASECPQTVSSCSRLRRQPEATQHHRLVRVPLERHSASYRRRGDVPVEWERASTRSSADHVFIHPFLDDRGVGLPHWSGRAGAESIGEEFNGTRDLSGEAPRLSAAKEKCCERLDTA